MSKWRNFIFLVLIFILSGETSTTRRSTHTPPCTGTTAPSALWASPQKVETSIIRPFFSPLQLFLKGQSNIIWSFWLKINVWNRKLFLIYICSVSPGTNLLSGGIESVLVQWRYNQENQRDFLPRLGAAITHIAVSPDGALYCTSHSDNSKELTPV